MAASDHLEVNGDTTLELLGLCFVGTLPVGRAGGLHQGP